jgi:hypothetical protein
VTEWAGLIVTNILSLIVPDEGYSRNTPRVLNLISTFLLQTDTNNRNVLMTNAVNYKSIYDWSIIGVNSLTYFY